MQIPFYKPSLGDDEINEVVDTLRGGWLTTGPRTKQFEKDFAAYLSQDHAVAVNSCTAALHLALDAIGLKAGQGVIVPTMTFAATAEVVRYFGARPVLADCREQDFNMDCDDAERKIQSTLASGIEVSAIIPVHYGGQIGDVSAVAKLASKYDLKVIEDAAHCCPAYYANDSAQELYASRAASTNRPASTWLPSGSSADISCYSFYANKTITTGEGGMACTRNAQYAERMRLMSLHGISRDAWKRYMGDGSWYYEIVAPGFKYNLTDIAAAIGIHQLRKADLFHRRRTDLAAQYNERLSRVEEIVLPTVQPARIHSWHLYVIRLRTDRLKIDRAEFIAELKKLGIGTSVHWLPLHMHPYYRETYKYAAEDLPVAASLYPEIITLPLYPGMSNDEVDYVCESIKTIVARNAVKNRKLASQIHRTVS
jgi:perosamine synthetase